MSELIGYVKGADFYLILSLVIFILVFVAATIYMIVIPKETVKTISELPLKDSISYEK
ncbi:MAG: hypothetical protein H6607_00720 [Flavobacteriales bacterium]|nr:hypothetical protein [Flavobacteriales bacterium]